MPANLPPTYNGGIPSTVNVYSPGSYTFPSTAFSSPYGSTLTYSATQTSGAALPTWLTFTPSSRTFTPAAFHLDASRQTSVRLRATDPQGRSVHYDFTLVDIGDGSGGGGGNNLAIQAETTSTSTSMNTTDAAGAAPGDGSAASDGAPAATPGQSGGVMGT